MYVNVHICQYGEYTLKQQDTRHRAASLDGCLSTVSAFRQLTPAGAALASDEVAYGHRTILGQEERVSTLESASILASFQHRAPGKLEDAGRISREGREDSHL